MKASIDRPPSVEQEIRETELEKARLREVLKPSPVARGRLPGWLRRLLIDAVGRGGKTTPPNRSLLMRTFGENKLLDHWGLIPGRDQFAAEPYFSAFTPADYLRLIAIAEKRLGCQCRLEANSWHYPLSTIRIVIEPRDDLAAQQAAAPNN